MRVGIGLPDTIANTSGETLMDWARRADAGPFTSLGVLDRILYDSYEPMTTLAAAAGVTTKVQLVTSIVIAPLRNTALLAKAAKTIHTLSGGRFVLGLSIGARQDDYQAAGVPFSGRGARFDRQLEDIRAAWEDETIGPRAAPGSPPILIGGLSDAAFSRVARYADGYIHGGGPPRAFARFADKARAAWEDAGRPGQPQLWGQGYFALGGEDLIEAGRDYLRDYYEFTGPFAERIAQGLLTTPQAIVSFLRGYADAGCDEMLLFPTTSDVEQLERLMEVVG